MALPTIFAAQTQSTGAQLDGNFAALGALTPIPCAAAGTNTIVLTPAPNTPTVTAYADYMQFTAVAAQTNTSSATVAVGSLAALPVYKNSALGPIALSGFEIPIGSPFCVLYASSLNSGNGGFFLMNSTPAPSFAIASITSASISHLSIGGGQTISRLFTTTSSISWPALNPQTSAESIIALTGASVGDLIQLGYPASVASQISYRGYVPNAGSVALVAFNYSASTITPTPGSYRVGVSGP